MYSIGTVSNLTGISPETLRAWERRYEALTPVRTDSGRRVYSRGDVERIQLLERVCGSGRAIGVVARLSDEELRSLLAEQPHATKPPTQTEAIVARALDAVGKFDTVECERAIGMALAALPIDEATDQVILPALIETGNRWASGRFAIAQERMLSSVVKRLLLSALTVSPTGDKATLVVGTLPGEDHELGSLIAAVQAAHSGYKVNYVGAGLPAEEVARTAKYVGASIVVLSFVQRPYPKSAPIDVFALSERLAGGAEIWIGGSSARSVSNELPDVPVTVFSSFEEFRTSLELFENTQQNADHRAASAGGLRS